MQSRDLTTQARILTQLNNPPIPISYTSLSCGNVEPTENSQDKLNQMADQASNFGYGCGVALKKAIDSGKEVCKNLKIRLNNLGGVGDLIYSSNWFYTVTRDMIRVRSNIKIIDECENHVREMEDDLKNLAQPKL